MADIPSKFIFNINQLVLAFATNRNKLLKMIENVDPIEIKGKAKFYNINDVASINDCRNPDIVINSTPFNHRPHHSNSTYTGSESEEDEIITDPRDMSPTQKINYYKAEDLMQSAMLKQLKNDTETGKLMIAQEVERTIAESFKKIALVLDTLPDLLERDGIIGSGDIEKVINVLDNSRQQLAIDLSEISPKTKDINDKGSW